MSCRVLKRDLELAMMDALVRRCQEENISRLYGIYLPTGKNDLVCNFYDLMGFEKVSEDEKGNTEWVYQITDSYEQKNKLMEVEE